MTPDTRSSTQPQRLSISPKPLEAVQNLKIIRELIMRNQPWPPSLKIWFCSAVDQRLKNPYRSLDQRLGLRSRSGGRLDATSTLPQLHTEIRRLSGTTGTPAERARKLAARVAGHRRDSDRELALIEVKFGRIPASSRQLDRIISRRTEASRYEIL